MQHTYVRWLGAYRSSHPDLYASIMFECKRRDESACEALYRKNGRLVSGVAPHASVVGLLINPTSIFRHFDKDCSSRYKDGKLVMGWVRDKSSHSEHWIHCGDDTVQGIVVYGSLDELKKGSRDAVTRASQELGLPIYYLRRCGDLILIK